MKYFFKGLFFLIYFLSFSILSAAHINDFSEPIYQAKLYFDVNDLEIYDTVILIHFEDSLIETDVIRTDEQGLYIFEDDILSCGIEKVKKWKCPYCHHWWPYGQKCQYPGCPTNLW